MTARDELSEYLLGCRKRAKLTQDQAGKELDVDPSQISRWENGKQLPKPSRSKELAQVYKVDRAEMSERIAAAWEEEAAEGSQAMRIVSSLSEAVASLQAMMTELLRRNPDNS